MLKRNAKTFCFILGVIAFSCSSEEKATGSGKITGVKDFDEFYLRFHRDTAYQAAHITFPLEGLPSNADSTTIAEGTFRWQRADWVAHKLIDDKEFTREFNGVGDMIIVENIRHNSGEYGMVRRWAKMDGEWYLIYYIGLNRIAMQTG